MWSDHRLDDLSKKVGDGFAAADEKMDKGFARVDARFEKLDDKFDRKFDRLTWGLLATAASIIAALIGAIVTHAL
jgi:hypothetical protein